MNDGIGLAEALLGLDGFRVLAVTETPAEVVIEIETSAELVGCSAEADIVLAGHTHKPTDRVIGGVRAVVGGSVSNPITDDLRAGHVIVHAGRHGHRLEHRRVPYDRDAFLRRIRDSGHPEHDYIASFQRGEQVQYRSQRTGAPTVRD